MTLMDPNAAERAHHTARRLGMVCGARTGLPMTADQIDRLRRVVLQTAGRSM